MNERLIKQAEKLTAEPYTIEIMRDETTTGESIFLLSHPELPNCMAQGQSIEEAAVNLEDATREYILSLLEDSLPVPPPAVTQVPVTTPSLGSTVFDVYTAYQEPDFLDNLSEVVQPVRRERLGMVSPIEIG